MWLIGFSPWWAALGLLCDELDGEAARNLGQESSFGDAYDSATDLCLATATLVRMGLPWAMLAPLVTAGSVALREGAWKPPLGSARAVATMLALPGLP